MSLKEVREKATKDRGWKRAFWQREGQQRQRPEAGVPAVFFRKNKKASMAGVWQRGGAGSEAQSRARSGGLVCNLRTLVFSI